MSSAVMPMSCMGQMCASRMVWPKWAVRLAELRVDVFLPEDKVQSELDGLNQRRERLLGDAQLLPQLSGLPTQLQVHVRQADGEFFVYVVDRYTGSIVAYVTLNRLIEINRRADALFRSPHTKVAKGYRRRGIASAVYRWWLDSGRSLMTGARQSPAARGLWLHMSREYQLTHVRLERKEVHELGNDLSSHELDQLNTRAVLLGRACDLDFLGPAKRDAGL